METTAGAIPIRMDSAMLIFARSFFDAFHLPSFTLPKARRGNLSEIQQRRRQATIDLLSVSPHLRRDIGILEESFSQRGR